MYTVATELTARVIELRTEIARVEHAELPVDDVVAARLAEFDRDVAAARPAPFRFWQPLYGRPPSLAEVERFTEATLGLLFPIETRALIETAARARAEGHQVLRMTASDKAAKLAALRTSLTVALAKCEHARRRIEANGGEMMPRTGPDADCAIWLLTDTDLDRAINGLPPTPDADDTGTERSRAHALTRPNDQIAGRI